jgi:hypothetical protein
MYFRKGLEEAESEWSQHAAKSVIDTKAKGLRGSIPQHFPYFYVQFGYANGFVHVIDNERKFDRNFGRQVRSTCSEGRVFGRGCSGPARVMNGRAYLPLCSLHSAQLVAESVCGMGAQDQGQPCQVANTGCPGSHQGCISGAIIVGAWCLPVCRWPTHVYVDTPSSIAFCLACRCW